MVQLIDHFYSTLFPTFGRYLPSDDFYFRLGRLWRHPHSDRFGLLHKYSKYNYFNPNHQLPKLTSKTYQELCFERAEQLIKQYPDGMDVMWSGGVDSTGIICIFHLLGYKNLHIIGSHTSLQEYPKFVDFIKQNFNYSFVPKELYFPDAYSKYAKHKIILNGFCNDQLFHKGISTSNSSLALEDPWQNFIKKYYKERNIESFIDNDISIFEEYSSYLNWPIYTLRDFYHLVNFGLHWEVARDTFNLVSTTPNENKPLTGFFDTQDLQDWAYTNRVAINNATKQWASGQFDQYKKPLKDIIFEVTKDDDYCRTKAKEASIRHAMTLHRDESKTHLLLSVIHDTEGYKNYSKSIDSSKNISVESYTKYHVKNLERYLKNE